MANPATDPALVPPQNLEAEENVLGAILLSATAADVCAEILAAGDFYRESYGAIYAVCLEVHQEGVPVDAITVIERLAEKPDGKASLLETVGGRAKIHELANIVPATANVGHYARIVRENALLRGLVASGQKIASLGYDRPGDTDDLVDQAEALIFQLRAGGDRETFAPAGDGLAAVLDRLRDLYENGSDVIGVPTGFRDLDKLTAGLQPGNLIVLAARPSMGKSALALSLCANCSVTEATPSGLFTLEMSRDEILQRLLSMLGSVESTRLKTGQLSPEDWDRVYSAGQKIERAPLLVDDSPGLTLLELRSKARRLKVRNPKLGLLVVDYLQLMTSGTGEENRVQEVATISRSLKQLARELALPVVALSQLNRNVEQRHDKRPILADLRESGAVEQDADIVAFVYRDEYYNPEDTDQAGVAEVIVAKHRNGPTGTVKLAFVSRYARFTDLAYAGDVGRER